MPTPPAPPAAPAPAPSAPAPTHSLRARLLWLLLAAVSVAAALQSAITYGVLLREADAIFDYQMQQVAASLQGPVEDRPAAPLPIDPGRLELAIRVWSLDGRYLFEAGTRTRLPRRAVPGFANVATDDGEYRVLSIQRGEWVIQVAQDLALRRALARSLALRTVWPVAVLAPLLMLVVWWVVDRSLGPVMRARRQIAARAVDDLSPLSTRGLPEEVEPLVHELNLLFERVGRAIASQRDFVADAAHELRSPLAALRLQAQAIERAGSDEARAVAVARLQAGVDRAARMVGQLLALAREESAGGTGERDAPVAIDGLVRGVLAEIATPRSGRAAEPRLRGAGPWTVRGDPESLRMAVRNLVENAVKHAPADGDAPADGAIEVTIEAAGTVLRLDVEDAGHGIPAALRDRAFDRFFRMPGSHSPGSGLGLAIVRRIVERHGGSVSLDASPRLGGLRARVELPLDFAASGLRSA